MRQPYATMFAGYQDHWLLGQYLTGEEPDWLGLHLEERIESLSTGERALLDFAAAWAKVFCAGYVDDDVRDRVRIALAEWMFPI